MVEVTCDEENFNLISKITYFIMGYQLLAFKIHTFWKIMANIIQI